MAKEPKQSSAVGWFDPRRRIALSQSRIPFFSSRQACFFDFRGVRSAIPVQPFLP